MAESISITQYQIGEHESFPLDGLTDRASDGSRENGTRPGERMELSPLAAWIDVLGKLRQKAGIEFPPRQLARKDFRVHARDRGTKPPVHHLLRELTCIATPKRKKRFDTGVLEKAV